MKKITFLSVALFIFGLHGKASGINSESQKLNFGFDEPITFTERGIVFFVFPNGEFDFNTEPSHGDYYYRGNNLNNSRPGDGVRIEHDALGRVRRIGNVFVNYDNASRIKRIGSVYMSYYRSALTQIGGMKLIYDRRGQLIHVIGSVKGNIHPNAYHYQPATYYGPAPGYIQNDYYYYKSDGTKAKIEEKEDVRR